MLMGAVAISLGWWPLHLLLLAVGFGVGAYGTLIGAGGGFALVPVLLVSKRHVDQVLHEAGDTSNSTSRWFGWRRAGWSAVGRRVRLAAPATVAVARLGSEECVAGAVAL